jgi:CBS domain-containing protein
MYPIGGVARLMGIPRRPIAEIVVAVAGPIVNVAIAAIIAGCYYFQGDSLQAIFTSTSTQADFWHNLLGVNLFLVLFNMIPAFPMDGGRVLRAVLASRLGRLDGTFYAMWIGRGFATLFIGYGLVSSFSFLQQYLNIAVPQNPFLMLIGGFILVGASREYEMEQHASVLKRKTVQDILRDRFCTILYNDPISVAVNLSINGMEKDFLIGTLDGRISGLLTREAIEEALKNGHIECEVRDYAIINFEPLAPTDTLQIAMDRMNNGGFPMLPVVHENRLLGVVDLEKITWLMKID